MNKLKIFANQKPVIFSILLFVFTILLTEIPLSTVFSNVYEVRTANYLSGIFEQGLVSIFLFCLMVYLNQTKFLGSLSPLRWKNPWMLIPILLLTIINASDFIISQQRLDTSKPELLILYAMVFLSTGFFEEFVSRGVTMFLLLKHWGSSQKGIYMAVLVTSLIFSLAHIVNFLMGRYSLLSVLTQIFLALSIAVYFSACVLRMESIYPVILLHALLNMAGNLQEIAVGGGFVDEVYAISVADAASNVLISLPFLLLGLFFLRKIKCFPPVPLER